MAQTKPSLHEVLVVAANAAVLAHEVERMTPKPVGADEVIRVGKIVAKKLEELRTEFNDRFKGKPPAVDQKQWEEKSIGELIGVLQKGQGPFNNLNRFNPAMTIEAQGTQGQTVDASALVRGIPSLVQRNMAGGNRVLDTGADRFDDILIPSFSSASATGAAQAAVSPPADPNAPLPPPATPTASPTPAVPGKKSRGQKR